MRKSIIAISVGLVLATSACASTPGTDLAGNSAKKASPSSTSSTPTPSDTSSEEQPTTDTPTGPTTFAIGEKATITQNGTDAGTIVVSKSESYTKPGDSFGSKPKNGRFKLITMTVRAIGTDTFDINPFDFYMRDAEGNKYQPSDGNAITADYNRPDINAETLNPNEQVKGMVIFDVPSAAHEFVYAPADQSLAIWIVK